MGESVTFTTLPPPCGMKAFVAAAWVICQVPCTFSSITVRNPFGLIASAGLRNCPPALLTSTSRRPWRSTIPSTNPSTASVVADVERLALGLAAALGASLDHALAAARRAARSRPPWRRGGPARGPSRCRGPMPAPETAQTCPSSKPGAKMRELGPPLRAEDIRGPAAPGSPSPPDYAAP